MLPRLTPVAVLSLFTTLGVLAVLALVATAVNQPWLGLSLSADADGNKVWIAAVDPDGPAAGLPAPAHLLSLRGADGGALALRTGDLTPEPDIIETYEDMRAFFHRQTAIRQMLGSGQVGLELVMADGSTHWHEMLPAPHRLPDNMPAEFWLQVLVGFTSYMVGIWVWSLRPGDTGPRLFAIISTAILIFAGAAAIYSTRELAIDGSLFRTLSSINHGGALLFGATMIALLLSYPRPLVPAGWRLVPIGVFGLWWLVDTMHLLDGPPAGSHLPTMIEMLGIVACAGLQYWCTRGDPRARAVLRWFGLSVTVGAGLFVMMIIAPNLVGAAPVMSQGHGFLFFLLIHMGLALGVARYRLFALDRWAFRILFYLVGILLLILVDAVLIYVVAVERAPAFGLSLLLIAFLYLPFRDTMARWLSGQRRADRGRWFQQVADVALAPTGAYRRSRWAALLEEVFSPLRIMPADPVNMPALTSEGLGLLIPGIGKAGAGELSPLRLEYAQAGRRLFSPRDVALVGELCAMLAHIIESRRAYEQGVAAERGRITRDMHDNIGVQLLGALHSRDTARKDGLIRETLSDLRDIINNATGNGAPLGEVLADLRVEIVDHLSDAGIEVDWDAQPVGGLDLAPQAIHALRSILREASGNIIRHAGARSARISMRREDDWLVVIIQDDGRGFDPADVQAGNGLVNMRTRMSGLKGQVAVANAHPGTRITAHFPLAGTGETP
ncbi:sensor histidine kinase [Niveispirillum fermenti]|uniref:sensor histidine kinase n=1 Tax=Niveispirillum fermenti TaxID=1233113 RepID=UPI003A8963C9